MFEDVIGELPIYGVFVLFALLALLTYEIGYVLGRWYQSRTPQEKEGPTGMIVGSVFALMAFLLAITMGMANERYDTRRGLVMAEGFGDPSLIVLGCCELGACLMQAGERAPQQLQRTVVGDDRHC